jgi:hypothetical protein
MALVLSAWACGNSATTTTVSSPPTTGGSTTTSTVAGDPQALVGVKIEATQQTPPDFAEALREQKPIAVLFYTPGSVDDDKVRKSLETLSRTNKDIAFFAYDYRTPSLYGDLGALLMIGYTPHGVFIDTSNTVRNVSSGYVDDGTLKQYLANIRQP